MFSRRESNTVCYISSKSPTHEPSVVKIQRCGHASGSRKDQNLCHRRQARVKLQLALSLLVLTILHLYHFPPPLSPPVTNSSSLFTHCQPMYAGCCTFVVYFSRYCKIKNFYFLFVFYVLFACEVL